tara:strand:- start:3699 stop:3938 length:240 start_codon:yes stop_codon:yes gene_type:complete
MSNPFNRNDWFLKNKTNVDPVLFNIYNGCWIREGIRQNNMNNKLVNRNLNNLHSNPCNNKIDVESKLMNIHKKCNKFRL